MERAKGRDWPAEAELELHGSLRNLGSGDLRRGPCVVRFRQGDTLKHLIEAAGVPHTQAAVVIVDGAASPLSRKVRQGDRISVYPHEPAAVDGVPEPRLLLDVHLGKLARDLRALGIDTAWGPPFDDRSLAERALAEGRILLTRDRGLLMRRSVVAGYLVSSGHPREQLQEVVDRYGLGRVVRPFGRCLHCNGLLRDIPAEEARPIVPAIVLALYRDYRRCASCGRIYWKGTHWESMVRRLGPLLGPPA